MHAKGLQGLAACCRVSPPARRQPDSLPGVCTRSLVHWAAPCLMSHAARRAALLQAGPGGLGHAARTQVLVRIGVDLTPGASAEVLVRVSWSGLGLTGTRGSRAQVLVVWFGAFPEGAEDWGLARQVLARRGTAAARRAACCAPQGRCKRSGLSPLFAHAIRTAIRVLCMPCIAWRLSPDAPEWLKPD